MTYNSLDEYGTLDGIMRDAGGAADGRSIDGLLLPSVNALLHATLPPDIRRRYSAIRENQSAAIERLGTEIHRVLTTADAGKHVLSGKVADKVTTGIADLTAHTDYTAGVDSIA